MQGPHTAQQQASSLKYRHKLVLVSAFAFAVITVLIYQLSVSLNSGIIFAKRELVGLKFQAPLVILLEHAERHSNISYRIKNDEPALSNDLQIETQAIEQDLTKLTTLLEANFLHPSLRGHWGALTSQWEVIKTKQSALSAQDDLAAHNQWISSILEFIVLIADYSNLMLDPDIDTYYLMDSVILKIPPLIETTAHLRNLGAPYASKNSKTSANNETLEFYLTQTTLQLKRLRSGLEKAFIETPAIKLALNDHLNETDAITRNSLQLVFTGRELKNLSSSRQFFALASAPINSTIVLHEKTIAALDSALNKRITRMQHGLHFNLLGSFIGLLLLIYFTYRIYVSIYHDEERLRLAATVFESSDDAIIITDANNDMVLVNRAFTEITGYTSHEVLGRNPRMFSSGKHNKIFFIQMWKELLETGHWRGEIWDRRRNGEIYSKWMTINVIRDDNNVIRHFVCMFHDASASQAANDHIQFLANHDAVTGLPNQALLKDRIDSAIVNAKRNKRFVALLILDCDRFRHVNESLGPAAGDSLLKAIGSRLETTVRDSDTVARLGGDEFTVLLGNLATPTDAVKVIRKIQATLCLPFTINNHSMTITTSIGIGLYPEDGEDMETLLHSADTAMYRAKSHGRDNYQFFSNAIHTDINKQVLLEEKLKEALENNTLSVLYQPRIHINTGRVISFEALIRWTDSELGNITPTHFLPVAEQAGLLVPLGHWLLQHICQQLVIWQQQGASVKISCTLAAQHLAQDTFATTLQTALQDHGVAAAQLELAFTASALHAPTSQRTLVELEKLGIQLVLDQFGTDLFNIEQLQHPSITAIKIDPTFIKGLPQDHERAVLCKTIVTMAHTLDLSVIATGIETNEQLGLLHNLHCDYAQGYYFNPALESEETLAFYRQTHNWPYLEHHSSHTHKGLLIIDDEENLAATMKQLLHNERYPIFTAHSTQEGLELLATHSIGVVLSDHLMPEKSGAEFLQHVRKIYPDTVRILMSGNVLLPAIVTALETGVTHYTLTKPCDSKALKELLTMAFNRYFAATEH